MRKLIVALLLLLGLLACEQAPEQEEGGTICVEDQGREIHECKE